MSMTTTSTSPSLLQILCLRFKTTPNHVDISLVLKILAPNPVDISTTCVEESSFIYIFSTTNITLNPQQELFDLQWKVQIPFPVNDIGAPTLQALFIAVSRFWIKENPKELEYFRELLEKHRGSVIDTAAKAGMGVIDGWRCDAEYAKKREGRNGNEFFTLAGWESVEQHDGFGKWLNEENQGFKCLKEYFVGDEMRHVRELKM